VRAARWPLLVLLSATAFEPARAQHPPRAFVPPIGGTWDPVHSIGQPPRWKPYTVLGYGIDRTAEEARSGPSASVGVYRDLMTPVVGAIGASVEFYGGQRGDRVDAGLRAYLDSPLFYLHGGIDWNARLGRTDFVLSVAFPPARGGWAGRGGDLRIDWLPGRGHSLGVGAVLPLRQPLAGKTRPKRVSVPMPLPPRIDRLPPPPEGTPLGDALAELDRSALWLVRLHNLFWLTSRSRRLYDKTVDDARAALAEFRSELSARDQLLPDRATYAREVEFYHRLLEQSFGLAIGAVQGGAVARGRGLADLARRITLEEVFLPYNRAIGQYKQPDRLGGLVARARARFIARLAQDEPGSNTAALRVFDAWLDGLEDLRRLLGTLTRDSRMHWLPLSLVLRPDEHDTQEKIDGVIALALGNGFQAGSAALFLNAPQFQLELTRTLHETESYHVLWIHDFKGRNELGEPDHVAFAQASAGYLEALIRTVQAYDRTGRLPVYLILLDQHYYELSGSRLWMDLLERPLGHRLRQPAPFRWMEDSIAVLQAKLRAAVAGSRRLQAEAQAFGAQWIEQVVKVHVNITNPADLSFRSRHLLGLPIGPDNAMRDHRKIVIRDVTEADPAAGEVILAGVGVGDVYASAWWDDRALLIQGPAALAAKAAAREVLEAHGLRGDRLPAPLRPAPFALDYAARVEALQAAGATARVLQAHNQTGWGAKDATFVQMLLYDLVQPGTTIYVPDSLWTSFEWLAQLVAAAFRGCRVYVVAPALTNAPAAGFASMAITQELITRLVLAALELGDVIREDGGELRIGFYTRQAPIGALRQDLAEVTATYARSPFLHGVVPLADSAWAVIRRYRDAETIPADTAPLPRAGWEGRWPKLHRKMQFFGSASLLAALGIHPGLPGALDAALGANAEAAVHPAQSGPIPAQARAAVAQRMYRVYDALPAGTRDSSVLYLLTGSLNKDVRSMALDGEVLAAVAGPWALQGYLDVLLLSGVTTWVERLEEVEELLPSYSWLKRWLGRRIRRLL
jgi:phosphatidylserine/phosphatidylglycerophosphate/cardiolipin synthase-like enzyme